MTCTQAYEALTQILRLTYYMRWGDGGQTREAIRLETLRFTFPQELAALLHYNGLRVIRQFGDWNRTPLTRAGTSIISVCRKRG